MKKRTLKFVRFVIALPILAAELARAMVFVSRELLRQPPPSKRR